MIRWAASLFENALSLEKQWWRPRDDADPLRVPPETPRVGRGYKALFDLAQCIMSSLQVGLAKTVTGSGLKYWPIHKV